VNSNRQPNDILLQTNELCRYYQRGGQQVKAVDRVDLTITRGEFLAVAGASGSGKSTLLNLLAGLDSPTSGHVEFSGRRLDQLSRLELAAYRAGRVGIIFQSFNLLPQFSALRNVELALYFNRVPPSRRREQARRVLSQVGLSEREKFSPVELSGGERQRVAIARALVKEPDILLADEPTGNLDQENSELIAEQLRELNAQGLSVVLVTHDLQLAESSADRMVRMAYGRIVDSGKAGAGEPS
jgi:putative ABC transport system ATP-binding protein